MESWIIEGVHYKWGTGSFGQADLIFVIRPNKYLRDLRVVRRFIRTRLGLEQWNYKQTLKNLYVMLLEWNRKFDQENLPDIMKLTEEYAAKRIVVRNNQEILRHVYEYTQKEE